MNTAWAKQLQNLDPDTHDTKKPIKPHFKLMANFKYSLWTTEHESVYTVMLYKVKDTNSEKEVDRHMAKNYMNTASFYREESEINALYVSTFQEN